MWNFVQKCFVFPCVLFQICIMCDTEPFRSMDLKTPRNVHLTAFYKRSFAFHTVKNRMPVILTQVIDGLVRSKSEIEKDYGTEGQDDLKAVIGELSKLKYEIQTNKPLRNLTSRASDVDFYNQHISEQVTEEGTVTYFSTIWLLSECYMYRRIREAFELTNKLQNFDPFTKQKQAAYIQALPIISKMGSYLLEILNNSDNANKDDFVKLLKLNLWGNKCDLSLSNGVVDSNTEHLFNLEHLEPNILSDHSARIWLAASNQSSNSDTIDIICDNSGYEVFTDFCIADYIVSKKLATKIRFHVKTIPWFISDVMTSDFHWVLKQMKTSLDGNLKKLGQKWSKYVSAKIWSVVENDFWTYPVDYSVMSKVSPSLYEQLGQAKLAIFKGDLNYRKLFGEKNWDPVTPVEQALQGFHPTKLCTLRTIKADIVCGLEAGVAEKTEALNEKWMEVGDYGLIQYSDKVVPLE